jgi:hypothetical protein
MIGLRRLLRRYRFVSLGLVLMLLAGCGAVSSPSTVPAGKVLYHDPEGYFAITLPKEWNVTHNAQSFGKSGDKYTSRFDAPALTTSNTTWAQVEVFPYLPQSAEQPCCDFMKRERLTSTLHGLPAYKLIGRDATNWRLFSSTAEFDIILVYSADDASATQIVDGVFSSGIR